MAKYNNQDGIRPIVRFSADKYVKYAGNCLWDNVIGIIQQETDKAYLIAPNIHDEPNIQITIKPIWFPKSKTKINEILGEIDIFSEWRTVINKIIRGK